MVSKSHLFLLGSLLLLVPSDGRADFIVYDNLNSGVAAGASQLNTAKPVYGDSLSLTQGGQVSQVGLTLFNSTFGGNTGSILTGTMTLTFYDNTTPYSGGTLSNPVLGSTVLNVDFTSSGGLAPGSFAPINADLTSLNIVVPQNILLTQQFTQVTGTSTNNGIVFFFNPTVGSSPNNYYLKTDTSEGLSTLSTSQVGYQIQIVAAVPEPSSLLLSGIGVLIGLGWWRRKALR